MGKWQENGEKREKMGKLKIWGYAKRREVSHLFFSLPSVPRAPLFPFSPAPVRFIFPLPILQPTGKMKETSAEERGRMLLQMIIARMAVD